MKLTKEEISSACIAMTRGDSFTKGSVTMFPFSNAAEYCVLQMIGPPDKCKKIITTSWADAIKTFNEYTEETS